MYKNHKGNLDSIREFSGAKLLGMFSDGQWSG